MMRRSQELKIGGTFPDFVAKMRQIPRFRSMIRERSPNLLPGSAYCFEMLLYLLWFV